MRICYSELCLIGGDVERNVDTLIGAGAANIELMLDGAGWDNFHLRMDSLSRMLNAKGIGYSVHVPVWEANITSECAHIREAVAESYRRTIEFASMVSARYVVMHPGWCSDAHFDKAVARRRSGDAIRSLAAFNEAYGLPLLIENVGTVKTSLFDEEQFAGFLDGFPPSVGYIVDVGHAHMNDWDIPRLLSSLGGRLCAMHLHDNDGSRDAHAPLGSGTVDWRKVVAAAIGTGLDLSMVLEMNIGTDMGRLIEAKALIEAIAAE